MAQRYCGNKANFAGLFSGSHVLGTNYQCLRKGIGVGLNLPVDASYGSPYIPIDSRKFYCGKSLLIPSRKYFAIGSPAKCLSIGVGVGKAQKAQKANKRGIRTNMKFSSSTGGVHSEEYIPYIFLGVFIIFYLTKPKCITKKDDNQMIVIDWSKFIRIYLLSCLISIGLFYLLVNREQNMDSQGK